MPSFLPHLVIPLLFALAFLPMERRRILAWSPIVWAPDLDYFFAREFHRAALSNIWIPLILLGVIVWLWRRRDPTAGWWEYATRPGAPGNLLLVVYYLLSHIIMDIFAGGVVLLWPLTTTNFYLFFAVIVDTATNQPVTYAEGGTEDGIPEVASAFEWISAVDTAIFAFLVVSVTAWAVLRWRRRRLAPPPVVIERAAELA